MRLKSIDAIRGISILGILLMNISYHANIELGYVSFTPALASDQVLSFFNTLFVDGRFRTLFCLLFGVGLAIQYDAYQTKGRDPILLLKSRLRWLFVFGLFHGVFIFGGDILMLYSLCGLIIVPQLALEQKELFTTAKKYLAVSALFILLIATLALMHVDDTQQVTRNSALYYEKVELWYGNYTYQVMVQSISALGVLVASLFCIFWQAVGLMYLGVYLYRNHFFSEGFDRRALVHTALIGAILSVLSLLPQLYSFSGGREVIGLFASIPAIFVALIYAHIVVKLSQNKSKLIRLFLAPGKLALTLYIMQSVIMAVLLRWIIPEFNLSATQLDYLILVLFYTVIQLVVSALYLRYFQQGPIEYMWRALYLTSASKQEQRIKSAVH